MARLAGGTSPGASLSVPVGGRAKALPWWRTPTARRYLFGYTLLAPAVLYVGVLVGAPFLFSLYLALSNASVGAPVARFVGLEDVTSALETGLAGVARAAAARARLGDVRQRLAELSVQRHRPAGGDDLGEPRDHRRGEGRRGYLPATLPEDHRADDRADPVRRGGVRHGLHALRLEHRLPAHERRAGRRDRDPADACLQHGDPRWCPRPRRRDLALPLPLLLPAMIILLRTLRRRQY